MTFPRLHANCLTRLRALHHGALKRRRAAFSLVEVTIAIGIVSFALIPLMGVFPVGLMASQEAIRQTARTHILKQISSDLGMMSLTQMEVYLTKTQYFDYEGTRLDSATGALFSVTIAAAAPEYPGSASLVGLEESLQRVMVTIRGLTEAGSGTRTTLSFFNSAESL